MLFEPSVQIPVTASAPAARARGGFLDGVTDFFGSILDRAPAIAQTWMDVEAAKAQNAAAAKVPGSVYDAFGRLPGQPGYGTQIPPAGLVGGPSAMPAWVKPAGIAAAVAAGLFIVATLARRK